MPSMSTWSALRAWLLDWRGTWVARLRILTLEIDQVEEEIADVIGELAPSLIAIVGCGTLTAAKILGETAGVARFKSKDAYARHNGTAPLPVWPSNKARHRLSRTGNRQLNTALHRISMTQAHWHPAAKASPIVERPAKCRVRTDANEAWGCDDPAMRPTLLIVDDHAGFRVSARRLLEADGFAVVGDAEGVGLALSAVALLSPDVVLVDIGLPDGDGFDLCAAIVAGHDAVVVLTSSRPIVGLQDRLELSGARGFIPKSELSGMAIRALTG